MTDFVFENKIYKVIQFDDKINIDNEETIVSIVPIDKHHRIVFMRNISYYLVIVCKMSRGKMKMFVVNLHTKKNIGSIILSRKRFATIKDIIIYENILCVYSVKKVHRIIAINIKPMSYILTHYIPNCARFYHVYIKDNTEMRIAYNKTFSLDIIIDKISLLSNNVNNSQIISPSALRYLRITWFYHLIYNSNIENYIMYYIAYHIHNFELKIVMERAKIEYIKNVKKYNILVINNTLCIKYYNNNDNKVKFSIPFNDKMNLQNKCVETIAAACYNGKKNVTNKVLPLPLSLLKESILFYIVQNNSFFIRQHY